MSTMIFMVGDWEPLLSAEARKPYFTKLLEFVQSERHLYDVFPPENEVFEALRQTTYEQTRVVILGQDPYHGDGQAHGLAFSVRHGTAIPPSLRNILKELSDDLGIEAPHTGSLDRWAEQGVLLLNSTLTVRAHEPASHHGRGWEQFTDKIISVVNEKTDRCVFLLWGTHARKKKLLVTQPQHVVIESAHPSPLSAHRGFFGSKPFSQTNAALRQANRGEIDWTLN